MLDPKVVTELVEQQLKQAVDQQVKEAVSQVDWVADLENQLLEYLQARILARFNNLSSIPELITTVQNGVTQLFEQGQIPGIESYIDNAQIKQSVDRAVLSLVSETIDALALDPVWLSKIQTLVNQTMVDRVSATLSGIDLNLTLSNLISDQRDDIVKSILENFETPGFIDNATSRQLTIMDGVVVVENELAVSDLTVAKNTSLGGDVLITGDLAVKGNINTDSPTWQKLSDYIGQVTYDKVKNEFADSLVDTILERAKSGIDFDNVTIDGNELVTGNTLGGGITQSSLTHVGTLDTLTVSGPVSLNQTLNVVQGRIGVNTDKPESALSIWDEEVSISAGKLSANTAFIGTGRMQNLTLGINRQTYLTINTDGLVTIQKLQVGRNAIGHTMSPPNYSGTKGDILFNINVAPGQPFAWMCIGGFNWLELKV
jgi:hypothetical protein